MANRWGDNENSDRLFFFVVCLFVYIYVFFRLYFFGLQITADGDGSHEIKRCLLLGRKVMTNLDNIIKSRDITLPTKVHLVKKKKKSCDFSSTHVWMRELDYKES